MGCMVNGKRGRGYVRLYLQAAMLLLFLLCRAGAAGAAECSVYFDSALQTHSPNKGVVFKYGSSIQDNPAMALRTVSVDNTFNTSTCGPGTLCQATGVPASELVIGSFVRTNSTHDIKISSLDSAILGLNLQNQFRSIDLGYGSTLEFSGQVGTYIIDELDLNYGARVYLAPGDYWINKLRIGSNAGIFITGEGPVRLFVNSDLVLSYNSLINTPDWDQAGVSGKLFLYVNGDLTMNLQSAVSGIIYGRGVLEMNYCSRIYGMINCSSAELGLSARIVYQGAGTLFDQLGTVCGQIVVPPDTDADGIPDDFDPDIDGDGIDNFYEVMTGTDPYDPSSTPLDADGNGIPDVLEQSACCSNACMDVFQNGLQSHSQDGFIRFSYNAQLLNPSSPYLNTKTLHTCIASSLPSCDESECIGADSTGSVVDPGEFLFTDSSLTLQVRFGDEVSLTGSDPAEYKKIHVMPNAVLNLSGHAVYRIASLQALYNSVINLAPGDYWIEKASLGESVDIKVTGEGTARIFVHEMVNLPWSMRVNYSEQDPGADAHKVYLHAFNKVHLGTDVRFAGFIFSHANVKVGFGSQVFGGISAKEITLDADAKVTYEPEALEALDFGFICDMDGDGIYDGLDPDRDGDGIDNDYEIQAGTDPDDPSSVPPDLDGDGIPDQIDDDRDGDGHANDTDAFPDDPAEWSDIDSDGIGDNADPDRDGDGISNDYETQLGTDPNDPASTPPDMDADGIPDQLDPDRDGDGHDNPVDLFPDDPAEWSDLDSDGIGDNSDPDRDGDGIGNDYETQLGTDPNDPASTPPDMDADGIPDQLDDDRDGDGHENVSDAFPDDPTEWSDLDGDGTGDNSDPDRDGDGHANETDAFPDNPAEWSDLDGDGIGDNTDPDRDGDGHDNTADAFPDDPAEWSDIDNDGMGDNADPDRDGDGINNDYETQLGTDPNDPASVPPDMDSDGIPDPLDDDRDGDGHANDTDAFPEDPNEWSDLDGDSTGDNSDPDRDGDGISNDYETQLGTDPNDPSSTPPDLDADGVPDLLDDDRDGDGHANDADVFPDDPAEWSDLDNDGIGDNADPDRDGDGIDNDYEIQAGTDPDDPSSVPPDLDGDGIPDQIDDDRDGDGHANDTDAFPDDPAEWSDIDSDGIGDNADPDRDGDGISNDYETQLGTDPNDPASTPSDLDGDGIPDQLDDDRDGDGYQNAADAFPDDPAEWSDLDNDGTGDNADPDRDGDGISNDYEAQLGTDPNDPASVPPDVDADGIPDQLDPDRDGDGHENGSDAFPDDPNEWADLDGDGTGDNSDPDRDGDGFSNADETAAGTNPDDPSDFPDTTAPIITLPDGTEITTPADTITLTGQVTDEGSGVVRVYAVSDQYAGVEFSVSLSGSTWEVEMPLKPGSNSVTIIALDGALNAAELAVMVTRQFSGAIIDLAIDSPQPNAVVPEAAIRVSGTLTTEVEYRSITITVAGRPAGLSQTDEPTVMRYACDDVPLIVGGNTIEVAADLGDAAGGQEDQTVRRWVRVTCSPEQHQVDPPTIMITSPSPGAWMGTDSFYVEGSVSGQAAPLSLTADGSAVALLGPDETNREFRVLVSFVQGMPQREVTLAACDALGQTASISACYHRDNAAPMIELDNQIAPFPVENVVQRHPYVLTGTVSDDNLAAFEVNDQSVSLSPGTDQGSYRFSVPLALGASAPSLVTLTARDFAGNAATGSYSLRLENDLVIELVLPDSDTVLITQGEPIPLKVVARLGGTVQGSSYPADVLDGSGAPVASASLLNSAGMVSGTIEVPATTGDYELRLRVLDATEAVLASTARTFKVADPAPIPLELTRVVPADNETGVDVNTGIGLFFNKPVDPALLTVEVTETAHGYTYEDTDEPGTDSLHARGYELCEVHRDHQAVDGVLSILDGGTAATFYPRQDLAFGAQVFINVSYDGSGVSRTTYHTRALPTFVEGGVLDQFGRPVQGVEVSISELGLSVSTNENGMFSFGYGMGPEDIIPSGRYTLRINQGLKAAGYGSYTQVIGVERNRRTYVGQVSLPRLNMEIPFCHVGSGVGEAVINGGEVKLGLAGVGLLFPDSRNQGAIHVQFSLITALPYRFMESCAPLWTYSVQPSGIQISGSMQVDFALPACQGGHAYAPLEGEYVVLIGVDPESFSLVPSGVGRMQGNRIVSRGPTRFRVLDEIGYARVLPDQLEDLEAYADGELSFEDLMVKLQTHRLTDGEGQ